MNCIKGFKGFKGLRGFKSWRGLTLNFLNVELPEPFIILQPHNNNS